MQLDSAYGCQLREDGQPGTARLIVSYDLVGHPILDTRNWPMLKKLIRDGIADYKSAWRSNDDSRPNEAGSFLRNATTTQQ